MKRWRRKELGVSEWKIAVAGAALLFAGLLLFGLWQASNYWPFDVMQ